MTEEVDRRHGVNGNSSSKGVNEDAPAQNSAVTATGGRLKFFKGQSKSLRQPLNSCIITTYLVTQVGLRKARKSFML